MSDTELQELCRAHTALGAAFQLRHVTNEAAAKLLDQCYELLARLAEH